MKKTWSRVLATVLVLAMVLCMPGFAASAADTVDYDADHATSAEELTDADLPELLSSDGNHYPIVLVHGLFGWGGTEVLGLNYWAASAACATFSMTPVTRSIPRPSAPLPATGTAPASCMPTSSAALSTTAHITPPPTAMPATVARSRRPAGAEQPRQ